MGNLIAQGGWLVVFAFVLACSAEDVEARSPEEASGDIELSMATGALEESGEAVCGGKYVSDTCPNVSTPVSGWPQTLLNGQTYMTTGWKGQLGKIGPGLANTWVVITLDRTSHAGDADLYVTKNDAVSTSRFYCRPWSPDNPEFCVFFLRADGDYLTWGIDVYSVSSGGVTVDVTATVLRCDDGTVYTGLSSFGGSGETAPTAMACCSCVEGFEETIGQCCREISECTQPSDCDGGPCVDGYCCNTACEGQCERCDAQGTEGVCTPTVGAPVGDRPVCEDDGTACGGSCDGKTTASCAYPKAEIVCAGATCVDGMATGASLCDGGGRCLAAPSQPCAPYVCGTTSCLSACDDDADCAAPAACREGACVDLLALGEVCAADDACVTGFCADGVCCNSACAGECEACHFPGSVGICALETGGACSGAGGDGGGGAGGGAGGDGGGGDGGGAGGDAGRGAGGDGGEGAGGAAGGAAGAGGIPGGGAGGEGGGDAGGSGGKGDERSSAAGKNEGCGCRSGGSSTGQGPLTLGLLLGLAFLGRPRRLP